MATITALQRELTPNLRFSIPDTQLSRMEAAVGAAVAPNQVVGGRQRWDNRTKLEKRFRTVGADDIGRRLLGNIVVTVMDEPLAQLYDAIRAKRLPKKSQSDIEAALPIETERDVVKAVGERCVGFTIDADILNSNWNALGRVAQSVWYTPRLSKSRGSQKNPASLSTLMARSETARSVTPISWGLFTRAEVQAVRAERVGKPLDVPSLSFHDVLARADSETEIDLDIGDVIDLPLAYRPGAVDTEWGNSHVVTGVRLESDVFEAARILSSAGQGMVDTPSLHQLPAQKRNGESWDVSRIINARLRRQVELDRYELHVHLADPAAAGPVSFHLPPLAA